MQGTVRSVAVAAALTASIGGAAALPTAAGAETVPYRGAVLALTSNFNQTWTVYADQIKNHHTFGNIAFRSAQLAQEATNYAQGLEDLVAPPGLGNVQATLIKDVWALEKGLVLESQDAGASLNNATAGDIVRTNEIWKAIQRFVKKNIRY